MNVKKALSHLFWLAVITMFLYSNIVHWHLAVFGWIFLLIYFVFIGNLARRAIVHWFDVSAVALRIKALSWFLVYIFLTTFSGLSILWGKMTGISIVFGLVFTGLIFILANSYFVNDDTNLGSKEKELILEVWEEVPQAKIGLLLYLILASIAFYWLSSSIGTGVVNTPWQIISPNFIYYFFFSTLILGILIFTKTKTKILLLLICLHSLLLHAYLPLTHSLFYGADGWRHLANEKILVQELSLPIIELSNSANIESFDIGRLSYLQFWSAGVIFNRIAQVDLMSFNRWFLPILWSLLFPILLYEWGRTLSFKKKESIFFAWLGFLPFAWQSAGSFSLPVNSGFLIWLLALLLYFRRKTNSRVPLFLSLALGAFLIFNYSLYFVLFWLVVGLHAISIYIRQLKKTPKTALTISSIIVFGLILPFLEVLAGYNHWPQTFNIIKSKIQFISNLTGWYLANGPRPHDILTGNIIFNQTPVSAFVPNFLTYNRYWLVVFAIVFLFLALWAWIKEEFEKEKNSVVVLVGRFTAGLLLSYFLGRYFFVGESVLTRRLEVVLVFGLMTLFCCALIELASNQKIVNKIKYPWALIVALVIILSGVITASYTFGPDTSTVSIAEYQAMKYIWDQDKNNIKHCVVSDTYSLLALEAVSEKRIVGGGFPIDQYFAQPELANVFKLAKNDLQWAESAKQLTAAENCWLVLTNDKMLRNINSVNQFGNVKVFKY